MNKDKQYILVMFPYPSGKGLHVGHWYNYALIDSYARYLNYKGIKTFQPFGYDAFGLPAENYAKKLGLAPREVTYENIQSFREEMKRMNTNYEEKLITSEPNYVQWTQWIFTKLYEHGLAYKKFSPVNYCSSCETVLANEQVIDEKCDRCNTKICIKELNQWFFKITDYKDRLIKNLDNIDYPEHTIKRQRNWLENQQDWCISRQRKWGCPIPINDETDTMDTFVDSSFYYLHYLMDNESKEFLIPENYHQVDLYVGGNEHATMHLIYARFIHMFLYDIGIVPIEEPFKRVIHQGMITYKGSKMSKSKDNTIDPKKYDPDILRMYLMFIGPYFDGGEWKDDGIVGISRFLERCRKWLELNGSADITNDVEVLKKQIYFYMDNFKFNKVISELMIFVKKHKETPINEESKIYLLSLINIVAPSFKWS